LSSTNRDGYLWLDSPHSDRVSDLREITRPGVRGSTFVTSAGDTLSSPKRDICLGGPMTEPEVAAGTAGGGHSPGRVRKAAGSTPCSPLDSRRGTFVPWEPGASPQLLLRQQMWSTVLDATTENATSSMSDNAPLARPLQAQHQTPVSQLAEAPACSEAARQLATKALVTGVSTARDSAAAVVLPSSASTAQHRESRSSAADCRGLPEAFSWDSPEAAELRRMKYLRIPAPS